MATKKPQRYLTTDDGTPDAQERRVARKTGGRRVPGSGSSPYSKGDVRVPEFLVECKQTIHGSLSIKKAWLNKISREAVALQREPALAVEIKGGPEDPVCERDWVMVPARVFKKLTEE